MRQVVTHQRGDTLDGRGVLPGFRLDLASLSNAVKG